MSTLLLPVASTTVKNADEHIYFLDVLRGLAAATVMCMHLGYLFWNNNAAISQLAFTTPLAKISQPGYSHWLTSIYLRHVDLSQLAVAVFFLISGFVMPISLMAKSRLGFLAARAMRLYPTYLVTVPITCLVIAAYCVSQKHLFPYSASEILANCSLFRDCFWIPSIDGINWTLEIEIKFYLCCALLGAGLITRARAIIATALVLFALSLWSVLDFNTSLASNIKLYQLKYILLLDCHRLIFMLIGSAICNHWKRLWSTRKTVAVTLVLLIVFLIAAGRAANISAIEVSTVNSYLIAFGIFVGSYVLRSKFPKWKLFEFLAGISYPLYLIHAVPGYILLTVLYPYLSISWLDNIIVFAIVISAAWLLHRFIEQPSHRLGRWLGAKLSR